MYNPEKQVIDLTNELHNRCKGKGAVIVVGAALNIVTTAARAIPDMPLRAKVAELLHNVANGLTAN